MAESQFKFGTVSAALSNDVRDAARVARELGFDGLLLDAYSTSLTVPELSATGRRELRHVLATQNQQLAGLRASVGPKGLGRGADPDRVLSQIDRAMEAAKGLGAPLLSLDLGPLPRPAKSAKPKPKVTKEQAGLILIPTTSSPPMEITGAQEPPAPVDMESMAQVDAALAELGRRADRYGVTVAMRSDLSGFDALERAIQQARCPWFGVDLDPVAILRDEWSQDEVFSRLGSLVRHVRARDAVRGADRRTQPAPIGRGDVNWDKLMSDLDGAGYRGWITIDPMELTDRVAAAKVGLARLHKPSD